MSPDTAVSRTQPTSAASTAAPAAPVPTAPAAAALPLGVAGSLLETPPPTLSPAEDVEIPAAAAPLPLAPAEPAEDVETPAAPAPTLPPAEDPSLPADPAGTAEDVEDVEIPAAAAPLPLAPAEDPSLPADPAGTAEDVEDVEIPAAPAPLPLEPVESVEGPPPPAEDVETPTPLLSPDEGTEGDETPAAAVVTVVEDSYGADAITVLEGLEAVRERPSMYIGSTGPTGLHHLVWEVVDNSVDEAMAGHCSRIDVTLHDDGSCEVADDGRGIPVDPHPLHDDTPAVELVLTVLHAGGKFGGHGYKISGGLHGVGVSVVNALSSRMEVVIWRSGLQHRITFVDGGQVEEPLGVRGQVPATEAGAGECAAPRTGTAIRFWPDATILEDVEFRYQTVIERLEMMAFLNRGLEIRVRDLRPGPQDHTDWTLFRYDGGIVDYVSHLNQSKVRLFDAVGHFSDSETIDDNPHEVEVAFQWNTGFNTDGLHSFANGISTIDGGTHEQGFRAALTRTVNAYAREKGLLRERADNLQGEDVREGLTAIVSVRAGKPQFEGQTKAKLGNMSMRSFVERVTNRCLAEWLEEHPAESKKMVVKALAASAAREAAARVRSEVRSKSLLDGAGMPDKLKDCSATDSARRELFIVEGDSAGGSAVRARNPETQAVLPIRGKILNVERARIDRMMKNNEIQALVAAIGAGIGDPPETNGSDSARRRSPADGFDIGKARYHKVIVLADADVDGSHIRTLLLTFFYRQMRPLVEAGYVYVAQPPLYSTKVSNSKTVYLLDDDAKAAFLDARPNHKREFQRLKGLGEMDWQELRSTTMDPGSRSLLQVSVEQAAIADDVISVLMGDDVEQRKSFIVTNAREVRNLDF